jgi:tritrans,polycis-undecaprenyl-diphosphate synthase [geranylgeranyl-diphosphate specific]
MRSIRSRIERAYERLLERQLSTMPTHVAVIQDGNRRYAEQAGAERSAGHREGAETTEQVLSWCDELGIEELTLYTFSTENFERPEEEVEALFDLIEEKLYEFADADRVHDSEVAIRVIGNRNRLPKRIQDAIEYARRRTAEYDGFVLNIALAYGGRETLLSAAREVLDDVDTGDLDPEAISVGTVADRLHDADIRDVDLIIRTGGDCRTSNFLPWHANGNEAAVYFCAPYWPEFSRVDFLRGLRTYEHREESRRRTRARRALALLRELGGAEFEEARQIVHRCRDALPAAERPAMDVIETDADPTPDPEPDADLMSD